MQENKAISKSSSVASKAKEKCKRKSKKVSTFGKLGCMYVLYEWKVTFFTVSVLELYSNCLVV